MSVTAKIKPLNPRNADTNYMGDEPQWKTQPLEDRLTALTRAFGWYNYFYSKKEAKDMVAAYLDRRGETADARIVRSMNDSDVVLTTGWLCRMSDMGLELSAQEQARLDSMIADLLAAKRPVAKVTAVTETQISRPNIQDRLREKVSECAGELEGMFDDFIKGGAKLTADHKPLTVIRSMNIAPQLSYIIADVWKAKLAEFETVAQSKDGQLIEGYGNFTRVQIRNIVKFAETVVNDANAYIQIKKVERKPRKVKPVSPEKRAAKFKVCMEFAELKLRGLPAASLVDKSEAWLYDTKKRKLIHLVADSHAQAFTVKNNTVIGYSTAETLQKTLRKPAEQLKAITSGGKPAARKAFKDIRATEVAWNARGSEHILILKAW